MAVTLTGKIKKNLIKAQCYERGHAVIVGVSGGPDSTALAHILHALQYELGFHLHIAHYNHHLHRSANTDQKFVEQVAKKLNVPCTTGHWKNPRAIKNGSLEDAARMKRFQFYKRLAKKIKARSVILAHTQDDLAETVLMRILRGTGLQGLRGILPMREMDGLVFIRPMLNTTKESVMSYLSKKGIDYRMDPTNLQKKFFRNKVRLELMPLLKKGYNKNINQLLANVADNVSVDYSYLETRTQWLLEKIAAQSSDRKRIKIQLKHLARQHPALKRMIIRLSLEQLQGDTKRFTLKHYKEIEDLMDNRPRGSIVHLPQNISAHKKNGHLILANN